MSEFRRCSICKQYDYAPSHRCPPRWEVRHEGSEPEDADEVYAATADKAAEKYAADWDGATAEYTHDRKVIVRDYDRRERTYEVELETVPQYTAHAEGNWSAPIPEPVEDGEDDD